MDEAKAAGMQVIKRFSGGGTVVVDEDTVFSTLILQAAAVPGLECYPRPIMRWSEGFYRPVFGPHGSFSLRDHGGMRMLHHGLYPASRMPSGQSVSS